MREPPGPCGAGRLRCVWLCGAWPLCVPAGGGPPRGLLPRQISGRRVACFVGPGRCVCRWAAARPRDRHTRACGSEWSISKPGQAPPPPTGTAARPRRRPPAPRPGPAAVHRHHGQALQASAGPAAASYRSGLLSVSCPPWPSGPSCALHTGACGAVCGGASSRCPAGRTAAFHRSGIIVVSGLVLPPPINFACNSPPLSCRCVSVCSVVSLVFLNCMRLLLNAAPDSARRYRGGAFWTLSALPIDQTGCVRG